MRDNNFASVCNACWSEPKLVAGDKPAKVGFVALRQNEPALAGDLGDTTRSSIIYRAAERGATGRSATSSTSSADKCWFILSKKRRAPPGQLW